MEETRWKRPWLAAALGVFVTGLGHIYLRRLQRAVGWVLAAVMTSYLFVPTSALKTLETMMPWAGSVASSVSLVDLFISLFPLFAVGVASVVDAYVIARTNNQLLKEQQRGVQRCPECSRQVDPDVSFCPWCATPQDEMAESDSIER